jgi:pimeloyl-ACP methyl ester carboxylesterase
VNVYFISGLGADSRAFQKIHLNEQFTVHHIDWIEPETNETLTDYVQRLSKVVDQTKQFSLVGLSFGGVIAIEMAKLIRPEKLIIISSLGCSKELPVRFKMIGALNLHRLIPARMYKTPPKLVSWFFTAKTNADRKLLYQIFEDSSAVFLKWAVDQLLKWKHASRPDGLFHIHGGSDKLLPVKGISADYIVPNAGHLMVLTHAADLSAVLNKKLAEPD